MSLRDLVSWMENTMIWPVINSNVSVTIKIRCNYKIYLPFSFPITILFLVIWSEDMFRPTANESSS